MDPRFNRVKDLLRLHSLRIPPRQKIYAKFCSIFQAVKEAIAAGVDGYDADVKKSVQKAAHGLRLTREVAMSIASKAVSILLLSVLH